MNTCNSWCVHVKQHFLILLYHNLPILFLHNIITYYMSIIKYKFVNDHICHCILIFCYGIMHIWNVSWHYLRRCSWKWQFTCNPLHSKLLLQLLIYYVFIYLITCGVLSDPISTSECTASNGRNIVNNELRRINEQLWPNLK
jgi:hypothetical protein